MKAISISLMASLLMGLMTPCISGAENIPIAVAVDAKAVKYKSVASLLENKLTEIVSETGLLEPADYPYVKLTPTIHIEEDHRTSYAPLRFLVRLSIEVNLISGPDRTSFASSKSAICFGMGNSEEQAFLEAINNIKDMRFVRTCIGIGSDSIASYYRSHGKDILDRAGYYMALGEYEEAITLLASVPPFADCYNDAIAMLSEVKAAYDAQMAAKDSNTASSGKTVR